MRLYNLLFVVLLVFGCKNQNNEKSTAILDEQEQQIQKPDEITIEDVKSKMEFLTSDDLKGRRSGSEGQVKAGEYIEGLFKSYGILPFFETYKDTFALKDGTGFNVVGYIEGQDAEFKNELVILGAHYDHIGIVKNAVEGDSIANGANDDASGTVAVLEFAKYFSKVKSKRPIVFALFDAEEMGLIGSRHLAERLKNEGKTPYTMINFEMVGVPRKEGVVFSYITGFDMSNMAEKLNTYANDTVVGFLPQAKEFNLFKRSDNLGFYQEFNMPAHAISTFDFTNFEHYHQVGDEADIMDYPHMVNFINRMIPALEGMVNSPSAEIKLNE